MAWVSAIAECFACSRMFAFNPEKVPSVSMNGTRYPVCRDCIERANPERVRNGLKPIVPAPGAYEPEQVE